MSSAPLPDELRKDLWHPVREWYARRLARAGELLLAFHLPSIGPLVDATGRPAPWHLARGSLRQRMALDKPRPNPTCRLCVQPVQGAFSPQNPQPKQVPDRTAHHEDPE